MHLFLNEKYLGVTAVAILAVGLVFLIRKWPKDIHHTFSQHAATSNIASIYYAALFTVVLPLLAVFFFSWFVPTSSVPPTFSILIALSLVCQFACTLVPEVGKYVKLHQTLAGTSGTLLLPSLIVYMFAPVLDMADRALIIIFACIMATILLLVANKRIRYALILQTMYFIAFFAPILTISYI
jgi:hypothetical protein